MQKVYLLLRNNQQTGPHSLEELIQLSLKPFDLIWVEGRSTGWSYPNEIEALQPYVKNSEPRKKIEPIAQPAAQTPPIPPVSKKIFVSLPVNNTSGSLATVTASAAAISPGEAFDQKAEELRQRAQAFMAANAPVENIKTNYARSLDQAEEEYTNWIFQTKTKKKTRLTQKQILVTGVLIGVLLTGWAAKKLFWTKPSTINAVAQQKQKVDHLQNVPVEIIPDENNIAQSHTQSPSTSSLVSKKKQNKKEPTQKKSAAKLISTSPKPQVAIQQAPNEEKPNTPIVQQENHEVATAPTQQKKKLKESISDFFKKIKKRDAPAEDHTTDNGNNERKSARRGEENIATPVETDLSGQVEVKMNNKLNDWMMGVQGLKLTLYNRSTLNLKAATVEVLYYSEQNSLLQNSTVHFSSIAPKKSQTVSAPDHRLADHVEYKLISTVGESAEYAKH